MSRRTRSSAALAVLLTLLATATAAQARPKIPPLPVLHNYAVRISMQNTVQDTHSLIAGCGNDSFDWDGATARTGDVLTHVAQGPAPATKFKTGAFSLRAHDVEHCVPTDFGAASGSCATTWDYKVNFRLVKKRKH